MYTGNNIQELKKFSPRLAEELIINLYMFTAK